MNISHKIVLNLLLIVVISYSGVAQWTQTVAPVLNVTGLLTDGTRIFVASANVGIFVSTDDGDTWQPRNSNYNASGLLGIYIAGDTIYSFGGGAYQQMGVTDTLWHDAITQSARSMYVSGSLKIYGNSGGAGIGRSTDYGATWSFATINNPPSSMLVSSFIGLGSALLSAHNSGIHRSTNDGATWDSIYGGFPTPQVSAFHNHATGLYAAGMLSLFPMLLRSTDNGTTWSNITTTGFSSGTMTSLTSSGANLYCTVIGRGVYFSTNSGSNWTTANTGLTQPNQSKIIIVKGSNAFLGTGTVGVWKRPLSQITSVIEYNKGKLPKTFSLHQNYPNPFNPNTKIRFSIQTSGFVSLRVFNTLGQEIAMLVNEDLKAGNYEVTWNANAVPSGVYLYSLQTRTFTETRKLVLLR